MSEIRFEVPPLASRRFVDHAAVAAQLRARPGEWAPIGVYGTGGSAAAMAYSIKAGRIKPYAPKGSFEALARTVGDECRVYARYVGDAS